MDAVASALILEGAKLALQAYMINMKLAGKTPEQMKALFDAEKALFEKNRPESLKDV